jgi:Domain of unknown function (DUF4382)
MNAFDLTRRLSNTMRRLSMRLLAAGGIGCMLLLSACGGGGGSMSNGTPPPPATGGTAMVTLTDMPGDFLTYMVNVVSLKLTRSDGTTVETVAVPTTVDFAQLVNLSEVISAQQVPNGSYTSVTMTIDYAGANIVVDNGAGGLTVAAANIINGATASPLVAPNSQVTLTLQLPAGMPLVVTAGTVANLALDFNLGASDTVAPSTITSTTAASAVTVTVNPVLVASLAPDTTKQIRVRGSLVSVTNTSSATSYTVTVWPFFTASGNLGQVVVETTSTTAFTINGTSYTGTAGLTALAALPTGTLTVALGSFDTSTRTFTATQVFAGTSVPGAGLDSIEGTVTARSGDVLTVSDGFLQPQGGGGVAGGQVMSTTAANESMTQQSMEFGHFGRQVAVTVAAATAVSEDGQSGTFGIQDISVGQHLQAFGKFGTDASGNRTLDASAGSVRLMVTRAVGQYTSTASGVVTMTLQALDGQPASAFNFAGTGTSSATDATPGAYTVSVPAALPLPTMSAGFPVLFDGFVAPFGAAPPDFSAVTLENFSSMNSRLGLAWAPPGLTAPFAAPLSATNVLITQATLQSAAQHVIWIGPVQEDPSSVSAGLSFVPNSSAANMIFVIAHRMSWQFQVYGSFSDFITALTADLNGTTALLRIEAQGPYDLSTGVLSVNVMAVELND